MGLVSKTQKLISKSRRLAWLALKTRNQCSAILSYRIGKKKNGAKNGEYWFIEKYLSSEDEYVFDVGANRGDWTSAVLQSNSGEVEVYCYEPDPRVASDFKSSVGQEEAVHFYEAALGSEVGELDIFLNQESTGLTSAVEGNGKNRRYTAEETTLDHEARQHQVHHIDLLKIDVEGYEESVLRGASTLLDEERISCIQFEYGGNWVKAGSTLQGVVSYLESFGFEIFLLQPNCLKSVDLRLLGEYFSYSNYVAIHERRIGRVRKIISEKSIL